MKIWTASIGATILVAAGILVAACSKDAPASDAAEAAAKPEAAAQAAANSKADAPGVELKSEQIEAMGIAVATLRETTRTPEARGFAVVVGHDVLAQAVADVTVAGAATAQSRAALARILRLAGSEGAETLEAQELAQRQAATDAAAFALAQRKASALLGQHPPWQDGRGDRLREELAMGRTKLVRVTFPLGTYRGPPPPAFLRLARVDDAVAAMQWRSRQVWAAPADPDIPGRSFFAAVESDAIAEGEQLTAWAPQGEVEKGVIVPAAALLIDSGRYWCYVEPRPGTFRRVELSVDRPTADGYFATDGLKAGDQVVVTAAGLLLAHELHPGTEAE